MKYILEIDEVSWIELKWFLSTTYMQLYLFYIFLDSAKIL